MFQKTFAVAIFRVNMWKLKHLLKHSIIFNKAHPQKSKLYIELQPWESKEKRFLNIYMEDVEKWRE
jgi:hypothetical protein